METMTRIRTLQAAPRDFAPGILRLQAAPPSPLPRLVLWCLLALVAITLAWSAFGRLDIIAVAHGRIVPQSYLQIVQPAESGIVKELLVREGDRVGAGQVLARMDKRFSEADRQALKSELALRSLQLRRIDAELGGTALAAKGTIQRSCSGRWRRSSGRGARPTSTRSRPSARRSRRRSRTCARRARSRRS